MNIKKTISLTASALIFLASAAITQARDCNVDTLEALDWQLNFFDNNGDRIRTFNLGKDNVYGVDDEYGQAVYINVDTYEIKNFEDFQNDIAYFVFKSKYRTPVDLFTITSYWFDAIYYDMNFEELPSYSEDVYFVDGDHNDSYGVRDAEKRVRIKKKINHEDTSSLSSFQLSLNCD